jgi:hypothetical protein
MTDLSTEELLALADEWRMLDLQASMTEAEHARYEKLPLLMATALECVANWRSALETEVFGDIEATRDQLLFAVDNGANQADINRLNRAVWKLFDRASALRLTFRRIDHLAAEVLALREERERLRGALALADKALRPAVVQAAGGLRIAEIGAWLATADDAIGLIEVAFAEPQS